MLPVLVLFPKIEPLFKIYDPLVSSFLLHSQPERMEREEDHLRSKATPNLMKKMQSRTSQRTRR